MEIKSMIWPAKTRDVSNHSVDSRIWSEFKYRDGDIIISTVGKTGTTWIQQIVA